MLEVGQYGLVWHIGTSLAGLKPYRHFFETTAIHTNSSVATKCGFWTQNIADMCLQPWLQEGQIQVGTEGKGEREGEGKGGEGNRPILVLLFRHFHPCLQIQNRN